MLHVLFGLLALEVVAHGDGELALLEEEGGGGVEVAEHGFIAVEALGEEAQGAHEGGAQELALAVDAGVEQALGVQLELDPGAAVGDDLGAVEALVRGDAEEHAGAAVQLAHDHALGAVDDEGAAVGHDRQVAEVDFRVLALLEAAVALVVLVELVEAHADLQGGGHGGAALHALVHAHLLLHRDGLLAHVTDGRRVLVAGAALGAVHRGILRVVRHDAVAAVLALGAEVLEAQVLLALAGPVAHGVVEELDLEVGVGAIGVLAVVHGEHGLEHGLEAAGLPLAVQQVHLEEFVVAPLLDVDQVRDGDQGPDLGEVVALAVDVLLNTHGSLQVKLAEPSMDGTRHGISQLRALSKDGFVPGRGAPVRDYVRWCVIPRYEPMATLPPSGGRCGPGTWMALRRRAFGNQGPLWGRSPFGKPDGRNNRTRTRQNRKA